MGTPLLGLAKITPDAGLTIHRLILCTFSLELCRDFQIVAGILFQLADERGSFTDFRYF